MSPLRLMDPKELITQSWRRCQEYGLDPYGPMNNQLLTGKDLEKALAKSQFLLDQTTPLLEKLYKTLPYKGLVTVIVDRNGIIIQKAGKLELDIAFNYMEVGANWSEEIKGTNAIGLALHEKRLVTTHAEHHFFVKNHILTCAASPIYSPSGEFIGAINISARKEDFHPSMIALVSMMAESVYNRLILEQAMQEKLLATKELELTTNYYPFPLITLDHERRIIRANHATHRLLGKDCLGKEFYHKEGQAIGVISDQANQSARSIVSLHTTRKKDSQLYSTAEIIGSSPQITKIKKIINKAAFTDYPVIIYGESGTGKELVAQALHTSSPRKSQPFIAVNCSAIPESLIESELFGYERGAFTGANREGGPGKFEAANGGTLFLDEIGDMSKKAQAALLRVLQEKKVTRVGGIKEKNIDTRIIAATNKNLREEVQEGRFREDLYYRLKGIFITLPPLRERSDILELTDHLLLQLNPPFLQLTNEAKEKLQSYHWPGNIRELHSVLMQAAFLIEGNEIGVEDLQFINEYEQNSESTNSFEPPPPLINTEREAIKTALHATEWNISKAASLLKISRNTLYLKIKKYQLKP